MTNDFCKKVGERLKEARIKKGFTLKEVSERTGRAQSSISDNERGLNDIPFSVILEYCDIYRINVNDLVLELRPRAIMNINEQIGTLLKEARNKRDLSLRAVGERISKDHSTIHAYETGRQAINVDVLEMLCNVYGVSYIDLLSEVYYTMKIEEKH